MAFPQPSIAEFRKSLHREHAAVRGQLRTTPNDVSLQTGLREYRRIFGMLDAMTTEEKSSPFAVIDSGRIRRIARGAGSTDQEVIQLMFSYRDFCEQIARLNWLDRRGSA